jgi:hypothetical protein
MTLNELRYIVAVAQEKNFGRAAQRCFISQPALSVAIQKLEEELQTQLFERGKSEITVTPVGERIVEQAQRVLEESSRIKEIAQSGRNQLTGTLKLDTAFSTITINAGEVKKLTHTAGAPSDVQVVLWDDTTVSGQLQEQELAVLLKSGVAMKVPVALVEEYNQPRPQASGVVVESIKSLVGELNSDDWKARCRAGEIDHHGPGGDQHHQADFALPSLERSSGSIWCSSRKDNKTTARRGGPVERASSAAGDHRSIRTAVSGRLR